MTLPQTEQKLGLIYIFRTRPGLIGQSWFVVLWAIFSAVVALVLWSIVVLLLKLRSLDISGLHDGPLVLIIATLMILICIYSVFLIMQRLYKLKIEFFKRVPGNTAAPPSPSGQADYANPNCVPDQSNTIRNPNLLDVCWKQYEFISDEQHVQRVICVGETAPGSRMSGLAQRLVWTRRSVDLIDDLEAATEVVLTSPDMWKLLIVDVDHVERTLDIEDIVNELIDFREECKTCAVVLLSGSFTSDQCDLIRSAIADYSFKSPITDENLIAMLPEVFNNHKAFIGRHSLNSPKQDIAPFSKRGNA